MNQDRFIIAGERTIRRAGRLISTAFIASSLLLHANTQAAAENVIGVLTALSGNAAAIGKQIELGTRLAVGAIRNGSPGANIRLEVLDSACDAQQARQSALELLQLNVKIVVGPLCSDAMYAALDVLSPAGVPVIAPYIRATRLKRGRTRSGWLAYSLAGNAKSEAETIARILLARWRGRPYAIADDGSVYGRGLADEFQTLAEASGQKPVALANFRPLQSNQRAMLRRLAKSGLNALFVGGDAGDIAQIARDAKKLGLNIEIAGGESLVLLPYVDSPASVPEGILAVMPIEPALLPTAASLVKNLRQENIKPESGLIPGYALVQIAAIAMERSNLALEDQTFETILGPITFSRSGYAAAYSYRLHQWANGEMKPMGGF